MMVTFVSQCDKKAIKRTRRVLDAFADRIGDNTWQTLITQEGLAAVKKLLNKTATKNTAVACHWIRSRSRSDLIWTLGSKDKFDNQGKVPVNFTEIIDIKSDEESMKFKTFYANKRQQILSHHLYAVGMCASKLIERFVVQDQMLMKKSAFISGILHDLGKVDWEFQSWIHKEISKKSLDVQQLPEDGQHVDKKNFFEKHATHNEISLWLMQFLKDDDLFINSKQRHICEHVVYWHHAKPFRKQEYSTLNDIHKNLVSTYKLDSINELIKAANSVLKAVLSLAEINELDTYPELSGIDIRYDDEIVDGLRNKILPEYKQYDTEESLYDYQKHINRNAKSNLLRSVIVSADRLVSSLNTSELESLIKSNSFDSLIADNFEATSDLEFNINGCLDGFRNRYQNSERNNIQNEVSNNLLSAHDVAVLNGPAGCGKTKIALEWASLSEVKKIIWVCPRVQICESLFKDLTDKEYLPNTKVEICTGSINQLSQHGEIAALTEKETFSGDIVLTTIDQIVNSITTHNNVTTFLGFISSHVVFDEFHEFIPMQGFNLLFAELVYAKKLLGTNANTLLVSATPNFTYIETILDIDKEDIFVADTFNKSHYEIDIKFYDENCVDDSNPIYSSHPPNSIVISNTAITAQLAYIQNQSVENSMLFHGKFIQKDKTLIFDKIYKSFKKGGTKEVDVLRSGPILQASLNITSSRMVSELTTPENWLQRLGRLDRFGENKSVNKYILAVPKNISESNGKIKGKAARFLHNHNSYRSAYSWFKFLESNVGENITSISCLYDLYYQFYKSESGIEAVSQDLQSALKKSVSIINSKVQDPVRFVNNRDETRNKKIKKSSLRGDSRFVQMATIHLTKEDLPEYINSYSVCWQESDSDFSNCYTESVDSFKNSDLLSYVAKKHERIVPDSPIKGIPAKKHSIREQVLIGAATDPKYPIYLSYTPDDISQCLGEKEPNSNAIYYVIGLNQVIGAMSLENLIVN